MILDRDSGAETAPIPFNRPALEGRELEYMEEAIRNGRTSSSGPFSARATAVLQEESGAQEVLLTTSCTAALELSALLLDLQPEGRKKPAARRGRGKPPA